MDDSSSKPDTGNQDHQGNITKSEKLNEDVHKQPCTKKSFIEVKENGAMVCRLCKGSLSQWKAIYTHLKQVHPDLDQHSNGEGKLQNNQKLAPMDDSIRTSDTGNQDHQGTITKSEKLNEDVHKQPCTKKSFIEVKENGAMVCRLCKGSLSQWKAIYTHLKQVHPDLDQHSNGEGKLQNNQKLAPMDDSIRTSDTGNQDHQGNITKSEKPSEDIQRRPFSKKSFIEVQENGAMVCCLCKGSLSHWKAIYTHLKQAHPDLREPYTDLNSRETKLAEDQPVKKKAKMDPAVAISFNKRSRSSSNNANARLPSETSSSTSAALPSSSSERASKIVAKQEPATSTDDVSGSSSNKVQEECSGPMDVADAASVPADLLKAGKLTEHNQKQLEPCSQAQQPMPGSILPAISVNIKCMRCKEAFESMKGLIVHMRTQHS